jgi:hypothetical protein
MCERLVILLVAKNISISVNCIIRPLISYANGDLGSENSYVIYSQQLNYTNDVNSLEKKVKR